MEVAPTHSIIPRVLMNRHFVSFVRYTSSVPLLVAPSMPTSHYFVTFADPKSESFRHVNRDVPQSKLCLPSLPDQPPLTKPRLGTIQSSSRSLDLLYLLTKSLSFPHRQLEAQWRAGVPDFSRLALLENSFPSTAK